MSGWALAGLLALVGLATYLVRCRMFPDATCVCCHGGGRHWAKNRLILRDCWWCSGSGRRRRVWQMIAGLAKRKAAR